MLAETQAGATPADLAQWYQLEVAQIEMALRYIDEHKEEVVKDYAEIRARHARGNPPEIEAKLKGSRAKLAAMLAEARQRAKARENGDARTARVYPC